MRLITDPAQFTERTQQVLAINEMQFGWYPHIKGTTEVHELKLPLSRKGLEQLGDVIAMAEPDWPDNLRAILREITAAPQFDNGATAAVVLQRIKHVPPMTAAGVRAAGISINWTHLGPQPL